MVPSPLLTEEHVTAPPIARGVSPSSTPRRTPASDAKKKKKVARFLWLGCVNSLWLMRSKIPAISDGFSVVGPIF
jgi:hypothetical protein